MSKVSRRGQGGGYHAWKSHAFDRVCSYCGKSFVAPTPRAIFCSDRCSDKNAYFNGKKGINRKKSQIIERKRRYSEIGNCALCGVKYEDIRTMKQLGGRMQNAASVFMKDHILPRAQGGGDEGSNLRYLCWFCNMTRKDMLQKFDPAIKAAALAFWSEIHKVFTT